MISKQGVGEDGETIMMVSRCRVTALGNDRAVYARNPSGTGAPGSAA